MSLESTEQNVFDLAVTEFKVAINPFPELKTPIITTHVMRRPTFVEEDRRERMMPLITKEAGKVKEDGASVNASQTELDEVPANVAVYNAIIQKVFGYAPSSSVPAPEDGMNPDDLIQTEDENGQTKEVKVVDAIPDSHKSLAVNGIFPSGGFEVEEAQLQAFSLGAGREWTVKQEIGGKAKQEDGTLSPPDYVVKYTFKEPSAAHLKKFRTSAFAAVSWRDVNGTMKDRRTVVLSVVGELFDQLVRRVEGAVIDGQPFDVKNEKHLALIPGAFKKGAVLKLFVFLQGDLGELEKK